jgi:hypothetical protein
MFETGAFVVCRSEVNYSVEVAIVDRPLYLWAQNAAEPASSTEHTTSVELTADSPNPYTICIGDTCPAETWTPACGVPDTPTPRPSRDYA